VIELPIIEKITTPITIIAVQTHFSIEFLAVRSPYPTVAIVVTVKYIPIV
jgi:hypothetical protein